MSLQGYHGRIEQPQRSMQSLLWFSMLLFPSLILLPFAKVIILSQLNAEYPQNFMGKPQISCKLLLICSILARLRPQNRVFLHKTLLRRAHPRAYKRPDFVGY